MLRVRVRIRIRSDVTHRLTLNIMHIIYAHSFSRKHLPFSQSMLLLIVRTGSRQMIQSLAMKSRTVAVYSSPSTHTAVLSCSGSRGLFASPGLSLTIMYWYNCKTNSNINNGTTTDKQERCKKLEVRSMLVDDSWWRLRGMVWHFSNSLPRHNYTEMFLNYARHFAIKISLPTTEPLRLH